MTRARWISRRGLCWLPLAVALCRCGFPAPQACELSCGDEGACPDGFECQSQTLLCVPRGTLGSCEAELVGPNQGVGGAVSAAGGNSGVIPGASGASGGASVPDAGSAGVAGASGGAAGAGGQPSGGDAGMAPTELRVDVSDTLLCAGGQPSSTIQVSGGVPPYALRIVENSAGIVLGAPPGSAPGDVAVLSVLSSASPGQLILELEDSTGKVVQSDPIVARERPSVATLELPVACAGLGYAAPLLAEGGQGSYQWSVALSGGAPSQVLADLGLSVSGAALAGELAADTGSYQLAVSVRDSLCESDIVELSLDIAPEQSDECPAVLLQQAPDQLPPGCLGNSYAEALAAEGGEPPYHWAELELPPGLHFDTASATLSGVVEGAGQLRVLLSDALGRSVERVYPLTARDRCWLGYVSAERQPARLELVDVELLERQPEQARRSLPSEPGGAALDFRFAPSGRWLAYRVARAAERGLELVRVSDAQTHTLDAVTTAEAYAFARDSSALAVSFSRGEQTFLGGLELSAAQPVELRPGVALSGLRSLAPRAVPAVASPLVWYDEQRLAFLSPDVLSPARRRLVTSGLAGDGFAPPVVHAELDFSAGATLLESAAGVFVADPETGLISLFPAAGGAPLVAPSGVFASPSGALVARAQAGVLQLSRALELGSAPALSASGCSAVLAWSAQRELIACADERGAPGALTLWQAQLAPLQLLSLGPRRDADVIASGTFTGLRRAFSGNGSWLAVGTDDALYVARPEPAARLALRVPSSELGLRASVLAFAPDESALVAGAGNTLGWLDLAQGAASFRLLSQSALLEEGCSDELFAGYGAWCGSPSSAPNVSWSSGSQQVAFRSVLGTLQVVDVSRGRDGVFGQARSPDPSCSEACSSAGNARFQP